ncbi:MAG: ABC transporter substrate-binding protein [Burkholderiales bacterium]|uniref:ABC transporter substrate-binding protein n=1 Tax=Ottowia pentelensis TaxID=511108 RepID=A0ABV6PQW6_9BURK|nr:ABC transporter substrate-binding protein [Ottowia sp.]MBN9404448.1 ABC transporter substrate-binding protein [Burkholderiales bacterium]MBS0402677.1 ABC transporter substrate-binding protein [Pseudomonadota bacterium]MBS0413188.1 ABC transporter substrate-binding protein [Pseudomonadota bacterium]HMN56070.1 ABC transporter substrate-binding protein [Ottowia sp.]
MKLNWKPLAAAATLVVSAAPALADINVGVIFSLTGPAASLGKETRKAIDLMPNALGGEKINYIVLDDATDPSQAVKNARKLVLEDKVDVLFGVNAIPSALSIAPVAVESKTAFLAQAPVVVGPDLHRYTFRIEPLAEVMVGRVVSDMKERGIKNVGFIGFTDAWGELLLKALTKTTESEGIKITSIERYGRTDPSVMGQVMKTISAKPDAVFVGGSGTPAALPHITLRERGYAGPIYHSHAVANKDFLRVGGKAIEGARLAIAPVLVAEQLPDSQPNKAAGLALDKALTAKFGPDSRSSFAGASWDGWLVLEGALKAALATAKPGTPEFREAVRNGLEKTSKVVGANGTYTMSAEDHGGYDPKSAVLVDVVDGKWKLTK